MELARGEEGRGQDFSRPNMVTGGNVQIVWKKFLRYFDVEPRIVPLKPGNYRLTAEHLDKFVDENTICVVAIAGQTFTGEDDDIQEIHDWLDAYERKTGVSIPMHIDGASGGFVNPFLYPDYKWDFRLPRVQSINASGHKYGLVPPGLGWVIFRDRTVFHENLVFYVNYLGGEAPTATLNFSKSSATVVAQYYQFLRLGREGYTRIMQHTLSHAEYLRDRLTAGGKFKIMNETQRIPVVALTLDKSVKRYNEFDISNKVRERGWVLAAYSMPPDAESVNSLRIVVRPHLNRNVVTMLADDIERACVYLEKHGGNATPPKLHTAAKTSVAKCRRGKPGAAGCGGAGRTNGLETRTKESGFRGVTRRTKGYHPCNGSSTRSGSIPRWRFSLPWRSDITSASSPSRASGSAR